MRKIGMPEAEEKTEAGIDRRVTPATQRNRDARRMNVIKEEESGAGSVVERAAVY